MGKHYGQLDFDERIELSRHHDAGKASSEIARIMGRHPSTIGRELRRNSLPKGGYRPASADRIALSRCRRCSRIERLSPLKEHVDDHLAMGWPPEQISGRLRLRGSRHTVSHELIYRYIYRPKVRSQKLHRYLARAKATRGRRYFKRRRDPILGRRSIHERDPAIDNRSVFGHWEGDLMQFRTQKGNLLTAVERKTGLTLAGGLPSKTAEATAAKLTALFSVLPKAARRSITFDNGSEFAQHQKLEGGLGLLTLPSSVTPTRLGSAAPSKTQTAFSGAICHATPSSPITPSRTSKTSSGPTTPLPENVSAISHQPRHS